MITEDQRPVVAWLGAPQTHGVAEVDRIETHSAIVFLAGDRAYKLKRAVRFDYLDFSTAERRRASCEAEVRLNRRTAPSLYRQVTALTRRADSSFEFGGAGAPVDWVVEMNRFPQEALLDRLAVDGQLHLDLMPPLAEAIARLHRVAEPRRDHGGRAGMAWVIEGNVEGFARYGAGALDPDICADVTGRCRAELRRGSALLDARRDQGFVRECHGDLHLRNIVLLDGAPTLFDGVEFDDRISCIDVLYDLAFLLMDLWRLRLPRHANAVWNRYLTETGDLSGLALMPLFHACRAAVRAKTSATAASMQSDSGRRTSLQQLAREYLAMAAAFLEPTRPCLVAIGGWSGTGKSTVAVSLAPMIGVIPGAVVHRSDEIRKQLCGVPRLRRLGPDGYSAEVSSRVYATLTERARLSILGGHSAVVDAVFARADDRQAIEDVARHAGVPFAGVWLEAPQDTLTERVARRTNDPSDADAAVIARQRSTETGTVRWHAVDASQPADVVLRNVVKYLRDTVGAAAAGTSISAR